MTVKDLSLTRAPEKEVMDALDPIYISYFVPWNSVKNAIYAKSRGFHEPTHEQRRTMCMENFDQVDSLAYLLHP